MRLIKPSFEILASSIPATGSGLPYSYGKWKKLIEVAGRTCYKSEDKITEESNIKFIDMLVRRGHHSVLEHSWRMAPLDPTLFMLARINTKYMRLIPGQEGLYLAGSYRSFIDQKLEGLWHQSMKIAPSVDAKHHSMTIRFVCDRGVTHEIVRHRPASYSQESTRYVNYKGGCTFVIPPWVNIGEGEWDSSMIQEVWQEDPSFRGSGDCLWMRAMEDAEGRYIDLIKKGWTPQQARAVLPNSTKTEIVWTACMDEWKHIFKLRTNVAAHPQMQEIMVPCLEKIREIIPRAYKYITEGGE